MPGRMKTAYFLVGLGAAWGLGCEGEMGSGGSGGENSSTGPTTPCCDSTGSGPGSGTAGTAGTAGTSSTGSASTGAGGSEPLPCGEPSTFESGLSPSSEIHVATSGSDSGGDGSAGNPYATIAHAASLATPGTSVVVHQGTYPGDTYLANYGGTEGAPIWIGGAQGEARPIIQGGANGFHLSGVRYLVLHDLEITGGEANGINCDDGGDVASEDATRWVVFRNLSIHDIGTGGNNDCLKLSGVNDFWVLRSDFARCGGGMSGSGIDHVGCHRGVVSHSTFVEMSGNGVQTKGGSTDIIVTANRFTDAGERAVNIGGSTGFEFFRPPLTNGENAEARRIHVLANVIEGGTAALGFVGCVDCLAANNTIINPERWPLRILQETPTSSGEYTFLPASNGRVINNVIYYSASDVGGAHVNVGGDTDPGSFMFQSNLWYAHDDPGSSTPNLPVTEQGGIVGSDPGFVDAGGGDYHLAGGSPAIGAGTSISELSGDNDGNCYAAAPSVGAFEGNP